jgi:hypothetical protein
MYQPENGSNVAISSMSSCQYRKRKWHLYQVWRNQRIGAEINNGMKWRK